MSVLSILRVLDFGEVDICTSCRINPAGQSVARRRTTPGERPSITREETWRSLPRDFLHDQKQIWLFPTQLAKGKHWVPTVAIVGVTAGLVISDPQDAQFSLASAQLGRFQWCFQFLSSNRRSRNPSFVDMCYT